VLLHRWTVGPGGEGAPDLPTYGPPAIGELHDRFVRTGAGWRIASRRAVLLARADQPATPGVDGSGGAAPGESL
jgi:hypothetical protein